MRASRLLLVALVSIAAAFSASAQVNDTYVIPAVANNDGAFGTRWMTQISIFNPQLDYPLRVSIVFMPSGGLKGIEKLVDVRANSVVFSDNILDDLFDVSAKGALLIATFPEDNPGVPNDMVSRSFLVVTNTYNNRSSGTYGQTIPGVWTGLEDDGISSIVHGIRNLRNQGWRTNVGAVNLGRSNVMLRMTIYNANGVKLIDEPLGLPPFGHLQVPLSIEVDRGTIEFLLDDPSGEAVVFPYTTTIDQLSGDSMYQTPILLATAKSLYGKKAIDPIAGKRIDTATARTVRATATSLGVASLVEEKSGFRISK